MDVRTPGRTIAVRSAPADRPATVRLRRLLGLGESEPEPADPDVLVLLLSRRTPLDRSLLHEVRRRADAAHQIVPVALTPGLADCPEYAGDDLAFLRELHWIYSDDSLESVPSLLGQVLAMDETTAREVGRLAVAARRWTDGGRAGHDLPDRADRERWDRLLANHADAAGPAAAEFLRQAYAGHRTRRRTAIGAGIAAAVVLILIGTFTAARLTGRSDAHDRAVAAAAAETAVQDAAQAQSALARGDLYEAYRLAGLAVTAATSREVRETARHVLAVPPPAVTFRLGEPVSRIAWSPGGRYLAVGSRSGRVWLLDVAGRRPLGAWAVTSSPIASLRVDPTGVAWTSDAGPSGRTPAAIPPGSDRSAATGQPNPLLAAQPMGRGLMISRADCYSRNNGSCTTWLPLSGGDVAGRIGQPGGDAMAVATTTGDVDILDGAAAVADVRAADPAGTPRPAGPAWSEFLPTEKTSVTVTTSGRAVLGDAAIGDATCRTVVPSRPDDDADRPPVTTGFDCRGQPAWTVADADIRGALPPPQPQAAETPVLDDPAVVPGPTGRTALALDNRGHGYLLTRGSRWVIAQEGGSGITTDVRTAGVAFTPDGRVAAALLLPSGGGTGRLLVLDLDRRTADAFDLPGRATGTTLHPAVGAGRRVVLSGSEDNAQRGFALVDLRSHVVTELPGDIDRVAGFDRTGTRLLALTGSDAPPWPAQLATSFETVSFARVYDANDGEMLCERALYQPGQPIAAVEPDLAGFVVPSYERPLLQGTCRPVADLGSALRSARATLVPVGPPR